MNQDYSIEQIFASGATHDIETAFIKLLKLSPLNEAYGRCMFSNYNMEIVLELIKTELNQLKIWLSIEHKFGACGSTLLTENTYLIFEIADHLAKMGKYGDSSIILSELFQFGAEALLLNTEVDAEIDNLIQEMLSLIVYWEINEQTRTELIKAKEILLLCTNNSYMIDVGYDHDLKIACLRFEDLIHPNFDSIQ